METSTLKSRVLLTTSHPEHTHSTLHKWSLPLSIMVLFVVVVVFVFVFVFPNKIFGLF